MKKYCFNCGAKMEFLIKERPKFCAQCGKPLESSLAAGNEGGVIEDDFDDATVVNVGGNMQGLDFDLDTEDLKVKKENLQSLMGTLDEPSHTNQSPVNFPTPSKKEVLEQYRKEAGTLRDSRRSTENEQE
ncbi:hypothetical protein CMI37_24270 [Candidatus Pacearchaeota archaeon]|jgi:hypothetical protein|nr:hypothetical protein [Candidatus Pacearchaeota archaeon]|tara:strand:+ start:1351 stop:1740 length:390 start_codon:yes stop_codon:yes gene_type:complete